MPDDSNIRFEKNSVGPAAGACFDLGWQKLKKAKGLQNQPDKPANC